MQKLNGKKICGDSPGGNSLGVGGKQSVSYPDLFSYHRNDMDAQKLSPTFSEQCL